MATTHKSQVMKLYRRSLKLTLDWSGQRHLWRGQAVYIRSLFDAQKHVENKKLQHELMAEAEHHLHTWKHPDPYRPPTAPGGSKYERNMPCPILTPPPLLKV